VLNRKGKRKWPTRKISTAAAPLDLLERLLVARALHVPLRFRAQSQILVRQWRTVLTVDKQIAEYVVSVRGWVYVISNKSMPNILKIGFSTKDPKLRAAELGGTGVPFPYVVEYDVLVDAPRDVEKQIHEALNEHRIKSQADTPVGTEWFGCTKEFAIETIRGLTEGARLLESHAIVSEGVSPSSRSSEHTNEPFYARALRARRSHYGGGGSWTLGKRSLLLTHKASGRRFRPNEYAYEGSTQIKGFSLKNRDTPWVRLEDVEFVD
jgi:hypothetical protein